MNQQQKKKKLLNKYIDSNKSNKGKYDKQYDWMKDQNDAIKPHSSQQSVQSQQDVRAKVRIQSSDQEGEKQILKVSRKTKEQKQNKKQRKLKKKLRKALGLSKDEEVKQFLQNLQIQGIDKNQILQYLAQNKNAIIKKQDVKQQQQKNKKKKNKDKKKDAEQTNKFKMFQKSQSSDLQIPQEARMKTIYRNKDGTVRQNSEKQEKQKRKQQIMQRLAEWEKGMKKPKSDDQNQHAHQDIQFAKNNKVWDDPMKRWESKNPMKLLVCKYQGPPNRYNIKPGYRWDGVVRGNGFENRYLQQINLKKAKKDQQHRQYMKDL